LGSLLGKKRTGGFTIPVRKIVKIKRAGDGKEQVIRTPFLGGRKQGFSRRKYHDPGEACIFEMRKWPFSGIFCRLH